MPPRTKLSCNGICKTGHVQNCYVIVHVKVDLSLLYDVQNTYTHTNTYLRTYIMFIVSVYVYVYACVIIYYDGGIANGQVSKCHENYEEKSTSARN